MITHVLPDPHAAAPADRVKGGGADCEPECHRFACNGQRLHRVAAMSEAPATLDPSSQRAKTERAENVVADAEIKNVRKDRNGDITQVGVWGQWDWTVAQVVASIESHTNTFYVNCPQRADVYVAQTSTGRKFLKTTADTTTKNNLDNLPPL